MTTAVESNFGIDPTTQTLDLNASGTVTSKQSRAKADHPSDSSANHCNRKQLFHHEYHDYSHELEDRDQVVELLASGTRDGQHPGGTDKHDEYKALRARGGVTAPFPLKLHRLLETAEKEQVSDIVSWLPHGRAFIVRKSKDFVSQVLPKIFKQSKLTSFQRQLNLYGFRRITRKGPDCGGYYHELFLRGRAFLCHKMIRTKIKGTGFKAPSSPESDPHFYDMEFVYKRDGKDRPDRSTPPQEPTMHTNRKLGYPDSNYSETARPLPMDTRIVSSQGSSNDEAHSISQNGFLTIPRKVPSHAISRISSEEPQLQQYQESATKETKDATLSFTTFPTAAMVSPSVRPLEAKIDRAISPIASVTESTSPISSFPEAEQHFLSCVTSTDLSHDCQDDASLRSFSACLPPAVLVTPSVSPRDELNGRVFSPLPFVDDSFPLWPQDERQIGLIYPVGGSLEDTHIMSLSASGFQNAENCHLKSSETKHHDYNKDILWFEGKKFYYLDTFDAAKLISSRNHDQSDHFCCHRNSLRRRSVSLLECDDSTFSEMDFDLTTPNEQ